jgi:hypothetical protein
MLYTGLLSNEGVTDMSKTYTAYAVYENGDREVHEGLSRARALARYGQFARHARKGLFGSSGPIKSWGWRLEA